jgi:regulatory protein
MVTMAQSQRGRGAGGKGRAASAPTQAPRGPRSPRGPAPATPERLEAAALAYLERFSSSAAHLSRLLLAKVRRSARTHGTDAQAGAHAVEEIVRRLVAAGVVDDRRYAEGKTASLRRRGASARFVRGTLAAKGVDSALVDEALQQAAEGVDEPEQAAARTFARRRRLGPWRSKDRRLHRSRDLAALGRAGFSYEIARAVIDGEAEED